MLGLWGARNKKPGNATFSTVETNLLELQVLRDRKDLTTLGLDLTYF